MTGIEKIRKEERDRKRLHILCSEIWGLGHRKGLRGTVGYKATGEQRKESFAKDCGRRE